MKQVKNKNFWPLV